MIEVRLLPREVREREAPPSGIGRESWPSDLHPERNEDYANALELRARPGERRFALLLLDGMGGHSGGAEASRLAGKVIGESLQKLSETASSEGIEVVVRKAFDKAQAAIVAKQTKEPRYQEMGTTATVAVITEHADGTARCVVAHAGDSRAYLLRESGKFRQLTRDHSLVQRFVEMGALTSAEAAVHPQRNVIYKALGTQNYLPEVSEVKLNRGDLIALVSDGVSDNLPDSLIWRVLASKVLTPSKKAKNLVSIAHEESRKGQLRSKPDDISALVYEFQR